MRFPRSTKIFRGQLDAAPYAGVLFLLVIFLLLHANFIFVPGIKVHLPEAAELPGTDGPTVAVVVDRAGQFYFENQLATADQLAARLGNTVAGSPGPLTLVVQADEQVRYQVLAQLWLIARQAGISEVLQATRPPLVPLPQPQAP